MSWWAQGSFILYGLVYFTKRGYESASKDKNWEDISTVDLSNKAYLVTGANSGLGFDCSRFFSTHGATVHLVCRNRERGEAAVQRLRDEFGATGQLHLHVCDVSNMSQIRKLVSDFEEAGHKLDVLVNNAGVMLAERQVTEEGIEKILATNTLSTFLLTNLLLPILKKSEDPRVINISSGGMLTEKLLIRQHYEEIKSWDGRTIYARSKRHQVCLTELYVDKFAPTGIKFYSMHPGWADTPGVQEAMPDFYERFKNKLRSPEQGADTIFWLGSTNNLKPEDNGQFFRDRQHDIKHFCISSTRYSKEQAEQLWNWCKELTNWTEAELEGKI